MGKYFGTDGFRGEANKALTAQKAFQVGRYIGWYYGQKHEDGRARIIIGKDTRRSSYMLEASLTAGITSSGSDAYLLHVTTTPSVSYCCRTDGFDCGIMISASHNPFYDNGIKIMRANGQKIEAEIENEIEAYIDSDEDLPLAEREAMGNVVDYAAGRNRYIGYLMTVPTRGFNGCKVGLDCANGASWNIARAVYEALGAKVYVINNTPDGVNINTGCGSTHIEGLQKFVRDNQLDVGFAFDGDADRLLCVDSDGALVDGDKIMAICAKAMKDAGKLNANTLVATVMSNMGLFEFCDKNGIKCEKTAVGDRYVLERMLEKGYHIGGEQSGHVIFLDHATTGDGQLTAIQLLNVIRTTGKTLKELASEIEIFPQVLINVKVSSLGKLRLFEDPDIKIAIEEAKKELGNSGRVLVRASGTEPLVRVMLEGRNEEQIGTIAAQIAEVVRERLI
jgi:phosphoglucosamine mutase